MPSSISAALLPLLAATMVICYPNLSSISAETKGETVELSAELAERSFELRACVSGSPHDELVVDLELDASTGINGELRLRVDGRNHDLATTDEVTIDRVDNCEPELLTFEVLDPDLAGTRTVQWTVKAVATSFGNRLDKDGELSIEITEL